MFGVFFIFEVFPKHYSTKSMYTGVTKTMVGHLYQAHPVQIGKAIRDLVKSGFTIRD